MSRPAGRRSPSRNPNGRQGALAKSEGNHAFVTSHLKAELGQDAMKSEPRLPSPGLGSLAERRPVENWAEYCDSSRSRSRSRSRSPPSWDAQGEDGSPLRKSQRSSPLSQHFGRRSTSMSISSQNHSLVDVRAKETDIHRMAQRQKLIDYGKNTLAYANYIKNVPREARVVAQSLSRCPVTPRKDQVSSKRGFDGQIRVWRKLLHEYWNPDNGKEALALQGGAEIPADSVAPRSSPEHGDGESDVPVSIKVKTTEVTGDWDDNDEDLEAALQLAKAIT